MDVHERARDLHDVTLYVGYDGVHVTCICPYDVTDESRPCWPWDTDRDVPEPLPAPQKDCTYTDWIDNVGIEVLDCELGIPVEIERATWEPELHLRLRVLSESEESTTP